MDSAAELVIRLSFLESEDRLNEAEAKSILDAITGALSVGITVFARGRNGESVDDVIARVMDEVYRTAIARMDARTAIAKLRSDARRSA